MQLVFGYLDGRIFTVEDDMNISGESRAQDIAPEFTDVIYFFVEIESWEWPDPEPIHFLKVIEPTLAKTMDTTENPHEVTCPDCLSIMRDDREYN